MQQKVENTIPVYDICSLHVNDDLDNNIIAEPFATYLRAHPNLHIAHRHTFYHTVLFTEGSGFHTIDFERFEVKSGQIYFMSPGQVHSWAFEGKVDGFVVNFSSDLFQDFLQKEYLPEHFSFFKGIATNSVIQLTEHSLDKAAAIMSDIISETALQQNYHSKMVASSLFSLFVIAERENKLDNIVRVPAHNQLIFQNFSRLVEQFYKEKRLPKEYAAMLYITANHLNALCKDLLGKSAGTIIRERVLLEAKRLLVNAHLNIAEIAYQLNFPDNSYFTKFFKKYTSQTPEEFRKSSVGI